MTEKIGSMSILATLRPTSAKIRMSLVMSLCWYSLLICVDGQRTHPDEVSALGSIKNSLIDPYGNLARWNKGDPCASNWEGIVCSNVTLDDGFLHVTKLSIFNKNLSGTLFPELHHLSYLTILDVMWNNISGSIPREIGLITTLKLLLLNGNNLTGSLPEELGNLSNLDTIQIDLNQISGPIPPSFANMKRAKHFHMNNNSLSGQIPPELSRLPILVHLLLDNNHLSGPLPTELADMPNLLILQLDNNNFGDSTIPPSYGNMSSLLKLSFRNCSLRGPIPDWSNMPNIAYIDLSQNQLNGSISTGGLSNNITTINLSRNSLTGTFLDSFSRVSRLQKLSVANNSLSGSIPYTIWQNRILNSLESLILDFRYNRFSNISGTSLVPTNVSIGLKGNRACSNMNLVSICEPHDKDFSNTLNFTKMKGCLGPCPLPHEYAPPSLAGHFFCATPVYVGYRLKSPGFLDFVSYNNFFKKDLSSKLGLDITQLEFHSVAWEEGPRLRMHLKIFPAFVENSILKLNKSEVFRIREIFSEWKIQLDDVFGPYKFLNCTEPEFPPSQSGLSKGALAGVILGTIAGSVTLSAFLSLLILRWHIRKHHTSSKRRPPKRTSIKIDGVKDFTYDEMAMATNDFNTSTVVGQGRYGRVHRGVLGDGTIVAIKRAQVGSLQGEKEFLTEIEPLSRLHHRNLVLLLGYCDDEGEQMLIYEFMSNGTLRDYLSGKTKVPLTFTMRVKIALGLAKSILYLHMEANPPIFHRDIKATNILLDSKFTARVADFGLSRLAPVPKLEGAIPSHVSTVVKGTLVNIAYRSGMIFSILDERMGSYPAKCIEKFINLALKCCQDKTEFRPSMAKVVRELENILLMVSELGTNLAESMTTDSSGKVVISPSSSSSFKHSYISQDVSGSGLVSGVMTSPSSSSSLTHPYVSQVVFGSNLVSGVIHTVASR